MDQASLYARSNALQTRDAAAALEAILPQMMWDNDEESILDVGCGSGDITLNLLLPSLPSNVTKITGVDASKEMVNFASKNFSHNSIEYDTLDIENDITRQKFPQGFTKAISLYCLHWVHNQQAALDNIYDLLRPGGEALLVFLAANPLFSVYENMSMEEKWAPYMKDVSKFVPVYQHRKDPAAVFMQSAEDAGFSIISCQAPNMTYVFDNVNYCRNAVKAVNPFLSRMEQCDQEEYLRECMQRLTEGGATDADGNIVARYRLLVAHLYKPYD